MSNPNKVPQIDNVVDFRKTTQSLQAQIHNQNGNCFTEGLRVAVAPTKFDHRVDSSSDTSAVWPSRFTSSSIDLRDLAETLQGQTDQVGRYRTIHESVPGVLNSKVEQGGRNVFIKTEDDEYVYEYRAIKK